MGFELTHPKILRAERIALDRSAILPDKTFFVSFCFCRYICSSASDCLSQYVEKLISAKFLLLNDTLRQKLLTGVGFEPTHLKILRAERIALDRSAILPDKTFFVSFCFCCYICSSASDCLSQYVEKLISAMFLLLNDSLKTKPADRSGI